MAYSSSSDRAKSVAFGFNSLEAQRRWLAVVGYLKSDFFQGSYYSAKYYVPPPTKPYIYSKELLKYWL